MPVTKTYQLLISQPLMRFLEAKSTIRWLSAAVFGQGILSIFHFFLNLVLIRHISPHDYGIFALSFVLAIIGSSVVNALTATPVSVYTSGEKQYDVKASNEILFTSINIYLVTAIFLCGIGFSVILSLSAFEAIGICAFISAHSARHYSRSFGYARHDVVTPLFGDFIYVGVAVCLFAGTWVKFGQIQIFTAFYILAAANVAALKFETFRLIKWPTILSLTKAIKRYLPIWLEVRWALLGAIAWMLSSQSHSFILTSAIGPEAYAPLAAGLVLFSPIRLTLIAVQNAFRPKIVVAIQDQNKDYISNILKVSFVLILTITITLGAAIYISWPEIHELLYSTRYGSAPMGLIVSFWFIFILISAFSTVPSLVLQALREFKLLSFIAVSGAAMSAILVSIILLTQSQPVFTIIGIVIAELFMAILVILLLRMKVAL